MAFLGAMGRAMKAPIKPAQKMMNAVPGVKKATGAVQSAMGMKSPSQGLGPSKGGFGGIMNRVAPPPPPQPMQNMAQAGATMLGRFGGAPQQMQAPNIQQEQAPPMQPPPPEQMTASPEQQDMSGSLQQQLMSGAARPAVMPRFGFGGGGGDQNQMMQQKLQQMMQQRQGMGPSPGMMSRFGARPMQQPGGMQY